MEFLYSDGDDYYFMNTENYEQTISRATRSVTRWNTSHRTSRSRWNFSMAKLSGSSYPRQSF